MLREAAGELERLLTGGAAVPGDAAGVYEPGNTEPGDRNGVRGSVEKEAEDTEGSCGPAKKFMQPSAASREEASVTSCSLGTNTKMSSNPCPPLSAIKVS